MTTVPNAELATLLLRLLLLGFLALVTVDAALDKVRDWKGNVSYAKELFAKSKPFSGFATPLMVVLALMMGAAALLSTAGLVELSLGYPPGLAFWGAVLSGLTFVSLFFGLQLGKNGEAAKGVTLYFLVAVAALFALR